MQETILIGQVMCHQIEQLKEEIKEKDVAMIAEHFKHQGISKDWACDLLLSCTCPRVCRSSPASPSLIHL